MLPGEFQFPSLDYMSGSRCDTDTAKKLKVFPQQHSLHKFCTHITVFITLSFVPAFPVMNTYEKHEAVLCLHTCEVC